MSPVEIVALAIGMAACATDLAEGRIPNLLSFGAMGVGIAYHAATGGPAGAAVALVGLLVGLLVFFPFFALGAMGAGDVKLMAALGAWVGWTTIINVALYGAVAGGVFAVIVALRHQYLRRAIRNLRTLLGHWWLVGVRPLPELTLEGNAGPRLPYALPITAGLVMALWRR